MKPYKTSKEMYTLDLENEIYSPERSIHHDDIIDKQLEEAQKHDLKLAILLGGGSGAGKTRFIEGFMDKFTEATGTSLIIIDADSIKKKIRDHVHWDEWNRNPSYKKKIDCENRDDFVHDESSDISSKMIEQAIEEERSFVYDGTLKDYDKYSELIRGLIGNDYKVSVFIIDVSLDVALERVLIRSSKTGRTVPEKVVKMSNYMVAKTFMELKANKLIPSYSIFNNSISDVEPQIIAELPEGGEEKIYNETLYNEFISKSSLSKE